MGCKEVLSYGPSSFKMISINRKKKSATEDLSIGAANLASN